MTRRFALLGLIMAGLFAAPVSQAADPATPEEAKALAEKATTYMHPLGPDKAIADFNRAGGRFVDRELFLVVYDPATRSSAPMACRCCTARTPPC